MIRVCCLLYEGFQLLDVAGPMMVFELAGHHAGANYIVETVAQAGGPVRSSAGLTLNATAVPASIGCDTLLIPGGLGARDPGNYRGLLPIVRKAAEEQRRIVSVSTAAFILAEAGLLEGRRAVTHWDVAEVLADRYPHIHVDGRTLFARDGNIWTSTGGSAGMDLALAVVEQDHGPAAAARIAKALILSFRRPGTQMQQSALLNGERPVSRFSNVMAWAREHLREPLTIDRLAERAGLSVRQFTRAFRASTGLSAAKFVEELRVERARALIEGGAWSLDEVARTSGFESADRMRRSCVRLLGRTPRELRRASRAAGSTLTTN